MDTITDIVRNRYAEAARRVTSGQAATCGTSTSLSACCSTSSAAGCDPITSNLYGEQEAGSVPDTALLASLGCGNPTALAKLNEGDTVLDLGSGGGIDVILSARRVGPSGKAYGLDMTDEMLALAEDNKRKAGVANVEFLKGQIEAVPLPDAAVDVIISNCVINLSADKDRVLREAFRVLKPGGRFAISDVVIRGEIPADVRRSMELWVGCVAGALTEAEYRSKLQAAGFDEIEIETTRVYDVEDARGFLCESGLDVDAIAPAVKGRVTSAFVRARKPEARASCCGPTCCS
jgi:arsenite methyltransferase